MEASRHPEMQKQLSLGVGGRGQLAARGVWALAGPGTGLILEWVVAHTLATRAPPDRCQAMTVQLEGQRKARASVFVHPQASSGPRGLGRGQGRDVGTQGRPPWLSKGIGYGRTCPEGPNLEISFILDKPGTHFTPAPPTPPDGEWRHQWWQAELGRLCLEGQRRSQVSAAILGVCVPHIMCVWSREAGQGSLESFLVRPQWWTAEGVWGLESWGCISAGLSCVQALTPHGLGLLGCRTRSKSCGLQAVRWVSVCGGAGASAGPMTAV